MNDISSKIQLLKKDLDNDIKQAMSDLHNVKEAIRILKEHNILQEKIANDTYHAIQEYNNQLKKMESHKVNKRSLDDVTTFVQSVSKKQKKT